MTDLKGPAAGQRRPALANAKNVSARLACLVATVGILAISCAPSPHSGRWMFDAQGRVAVRHGLNVVNKRAPFTPQAMGFGEDDAAFLQENGFNIVRLGVIWAGVEPQPGVYDANYVAQIKATQQMLADHDIYVLLDWHQDLMGGIFGGEGFPDWAVNTSGLVPWSPLKKFPDEYEDPASKKAWDNFLDNVPGPGGIGLQDRFAAAQRYVAAEFSSQPPTTLGYDIINEPHKGSNEQPARDQKLGAMQKKVLEAIRTVDTAHTIFYEPVMTYVIDGETLPPFEDPNAGLSFHVYCFEPNGMDPGLYELLCGGVLESGPKNANAHSARTGSVNMMTEFGSADAWAVKLVANYADKYMTSWTAWAYSGFNDITTAIDPLKEGIVIDPSLPPTGSNIYQPNLNALVRPYPQYVAGTPTGWSFDAATKVFEVKYSTTPPSGSTLSPAATTTIFVPTVQYPNGYNVAVAGGTIASGNGTQTLHIAKNAGAATVTVSITKK